LSLQFLSSLKKFDNNGSIFSVYINVIYSPGQVLASYKATWAHRKLDQLLEKIICHSSYWKRL